MEKGKFATVISCIDGRVQSPVAEWMKIQSPSRDLIKHC